MENYQKLFFNSLLKVILLKNGNQQEMFKEILDIIAEISHPVVLEDIIQLMASFGDINK